MRRRSFKRTLLMILLLLTGGAIINVAVAWGCVAWSPRHVAKLDDENKGDLRQLWMRYSPNDWRDVPFHFFAIYTLGMGSETRQAFARKPSQRSDMNSVCSLFETRAGWPSYGLRGAIQRVNGRPVPMFLTVPEWNLPGEQVKSSTWRNTGFPHNPIWPGFAINTIFYAAILWLLFAAPGWLRRRIRIKRGQCPACAYPVGTSEVCTECGAAVSRRVDIITQHAPGDS